MPPGLDWTKIYYIIGSAIFHILGVFPTSRTSTVKSQGKGVFSQITTTSEQGLWRGNLILFAVFNFVGEILHQKWNEKMEAKLIW